MTFEEATAIFSYDPKTGIVTRKLTGLPCGTPDSYGYLNVGVKRKTYKLHRLIWLLVHGEWPNGIIDHIKRVVDDNRIENLRVVTKRGNALNSKVPSDSTSGHKGVSWRADKKKWRAYTAVMGKQINLGHYDSLEDAILARQKGMEKYGEDANHESISG